MRGDEVTDASVDYTLSAYCPYAPHVFDRQEIARGVFWCRCLYAVPLSRKQVRP